MGRVLVVDDEHGWRLIVRHVAEGCGHDVDEAADGRAALGAARDNPPDLIISDVYMPVMSGPELAERLRSDPSTSSIPIIMIGAHIPTGVQADVVLHKPMSLTHLAQIVDRVLSQGSTSDRRARGVRPGVPQAWRPAGDSAQDPDAPPALMARSSGVISVPSSAGLSDHACWAYSSEVERAAAASGWLSEGLRLGQRCLYVAEGTVEELRGELETIAELNSALPRRAIIVMPCEEVYDLRAPIDAASALSIYAAAVDEAITDGYSGLRVAADITPLIADHRRRPAHVHWEQVADRYMTDHPLAPICLYDRRRVDDIDAIVSAHPLRGPHVTAFALYAIGPNTARLAGEVDALLGGVLSDLLAQMPATDRVIDLSRLSFMGGRAAWILHHELVERRSAGQEMRLTGAPPTVRRLWDICEFDRSFLVA